MSFSDSFDMVIVSLVYIVGSYCNSLNLYEMVA